jgi:hypothetical protein
VTAAESSAPQSKGNRTAVRRAATALLFSLISGCFLSMHPLSVAFWDSSGGRYWKELYIAGERPKQFEKIAGLIPPTARVASTDFVHPRYTHFERSYDYSDYARMVAGYEDKVPDDTDYIVIDTRHPYSKVREPGDIRELKIQPDQWELLPDTTDGYFLVLKRRGVERSFPDNAAQSRPTARPGQDMP